MAAQRKRVRKRPPIRPAEPRKVYVETSVWGMIVENQPQALRQPTWKFLQQCAAGLFLPCISSVVYEEIDDAPESAAELMLQEIDKLAPPRLEVTQACEDLADAYLAAGVIPAKKRQDARHVAVATVAGVRVVVSWNHRHLANERKRDLFYAVNRLKGFEQLLQIHTPLEVMQ